ncbi:Biotin--protein ligase (EC 6.3.4.9, EC 6.3.4.10, EC 6.3.4.11, EC 6.3.4.15) / Biotin operon repressor [uncultured Gammaproteobacteria bacterium]|nr:Biotin--protein ligase (EC 6.3.4.9, EC 6.3.4.10, EC 6.3.4.11, EC 6.3.4.15) / Biotin operon repressor [uncultured Gammaproteobacteria bacterium]
MSSLEFSESTQVCIAREQTQGKGQYDRVWLSQKDTNVLFSIRHVFDASVSLNGLSLVIGLAVVSTLEEFGLTNVKLKWPNDVFFEGKKMAGILIENSVQGNDQSVVIGLGLNYQLGKNFECGTPWVDLASVLQQLPNIENLSASLINTMLKYCQLFSAQGLSYFLKSWQTADYLLDKQVEIDINNQTLCGVIIGVSPQGALMIKTGSEVVEAYSSNQIRLI